MKQCIPSSLKCCELQIQMSSSRTSSWLCRLPSSQFPDGCHHSITINVTDDKDYVLLQRSISRFIHPTIIYFYCLFKTHNPLQCCWWHSRHAMLLSKLLYDNQSNIVRRDFKKPCRKLVVGVNVRCRLSSGGLWSPWSAKHNLVTSGRIDLNKL